MSARDWILQHRYGATAAFRATARRVGRFLYSGAEKGAQPEVVSAIRRFRRLPESERAKHPSLWGWLLGPLGTPPRKLSKDDVAWSDHPVDGKQCSGCMRWYLHPVTGTPICDSVRGVWPADAWCDRWSQPWNAARYRAYQEGGSIDEIVAGQMFGAWLPPVRLPMPSLPKLTHVVPGTKPNVIVPGTPRAVTAIVNPLVQDLMGLGPGVRITGHSDRIVHALVPKNQWASAVSLGSRDAYRTGKALRVTLSDEDLTDPTNEMINVSMEFVELTR